MGRRRSNRQPASTIRARAAEVIEKQRGKMRRNLGAAIDGRDPEGVHAMRVASRRLRAALEVFGPWLEKRAVGQAGRSLRRVTRALGRVRELDVLRLRLAKLSTDAGPARKLAIEIVDSRIARRRVRARARMIKTFGSIDLDQLDTRLRELAGAPPAWAVAGHEASGLDAGIPWHNPAAEGEFDEPMDALIERLAPRVADAAHRIVETSIPGDTGSRDASRALHDVRIQAKKLRYQLEIIAPHRGDEAARLVRTLKGLQEHLGDFHDDSILDDVLADNMTRQAARARPLLVAELRELRAARQEALRHDEAACRRSLEELRAVGFAPAIREVVSTPPAPVEVAEVPSSDSPTPPVTRRPDPPRSTPPAPFSAERPESPPASPPARRTSPPSETRPERGPARTSPREAGGYAGEPIRTPPPHEPRDETPRSAEAAAAAATGAGAGAPATRPKT